MAKSTDKPKWIWIASEVNTEDCYLRARRTFTLESRPAKAQLRVTAFSEYALYVNGRFVGRGPAPSTFDAPMLDVYDLPDLGLARGKNVIAILAHNEHVGLPRRPRLTGGLWLDLEVTGEDGKTERIVTDGAWRIAPAEDFSRRAPRIYWTAGFTEVRDTRHEPEGWTTAGFSDRKWAAADEVKPRGPEGSGAPRPTERSGPRLAETFVLPEAAVAAGRTRWPAGLTAIPFEFTLPDPARGELYAATFVHCDKKRRARLVFDCDESAAVYVNNRQAARQGYKEEFFRWLSEDEQDDYAGIHRGQGQRAETADVELDEGWNSLGVVIYDPGPAWGFAMRFDDPRTGQSLPMEFSPDQKHGKLADWHIVCEELCPCGPGWIPDTPRPNARTFPDPAYQLASETQAPSRQAGRGAASLVAGAKEGGRLTLRDEEFVLYDFGRETVGYVELDLEGPPGAILDLAWAEGLSRGGNLEPIRSGMRQADRLILSSRRQTVRLFNRRALRYLELVARTGGDDSISVHRVGMSAVSRLPEPPPVPESADHDISAAMPLIARTIQCCVQDTLEGSPGREGEQSIPAAFFLDQALRCLTGQADPGAAALRAFAADQAGDGFFRAVVPAGTVHVVPDWNLLWIIWLADHVAWTGNRALAEDLYPVAERCLDWEASFRDSHGLLENKPDRTPWWLFVDLSPTDKRGVVTVWQALYARALLAAADVADFLGQEEAASHGRAEADAVAQAARNRLWDPVRGLFADARLFENLSPATSPQANYYALYGGLATGEQAERILAGLWTDDKTESADWGPHQNPYAKYFALEALLERGLARRALAMIRSYWGPMARAGLTTVPETFPPPKHPAKAAGSHDGHLDGPYGGLPPEVLCHAWGVHPAALLAKWVLGVRPGGPGFEPAVLAPMPDEISQIGGKVWTPKGAVDVAIGRDGHGRKVRVTVPEGMSYRLDRRHLADWDEVEVTGGTPA